MEMKEECIICKAPLIYLEKDEMMECVLCHKKEFLMVPSPVIIRDFLTRSLWA